MLQNLVDDRLILDTGYHPGFASALLAERNVDVEHALQPLCPGHGLAVVFWCFFFALWIGAALAAFGRRHFYTVFAVKHSGEMRAVHRLAPA